MRKKCLMLFLMLLILTTTINGCARSLKQEHKILYPVIRIPVNSTIIMPDRTIKYIDRNGYWLSDEDVTSILDRLNNVEGGKKSDITIDITF